MALLGTACGERDTQQSAPNAALGDAPAAPREQWTVSAEPRLRIAHRDTLNFRDVIGLSLLPDGGVVVASDVSTSLQFFSAEGQLIRSVGRRGAGPGEFKYVFQLLRFGDTLGVMAQNEVVQLFTLDGKYRRSEAPLTGGEQLRGYLTNGDRVVSTLRIDAVTSSEPARTPEELLRLSGNDTVALGTFLSQELSRLENGKLAARFYSPRNQVAVLRDGFCAGHGGDAFLSCYDAAGVRHSTMQLAHRSPMPVAEEDREAKFDQVYLMNKGVPKAVLEAEVARERETTMFAESLGIFGRLLASRDNLVWVSPPATDDWLVIDLPPVRPTVWSVYSPTGEWLAEVTLPADFYLLEAGADYVAGFSRDENEDDVVLVYSLTR